MSAQGSSPGRRHSPCKYESNGYAQATRLCRPAWIQRDESLLTLLAMFSIGVVVKGTGIQVNALGKLQRTGETGVSVCLAVPFTSMTTPTVLENRHEGILPQSVANGTPATTALDKPPTNIAFVLRTHNGTVWQAGQWSR